MEEVGAAKGSREGVTPGLFQDMGESLDFKPASSESSLMPSTEQFIISEPA